MVRLSMKPRRSRMPRRNVWAAAAVTGLLALVPACSAGGGPAPGTPSGTASGTALEEAQPDVRVTAQVNQLRDNYSKQIVSIELTNTSDTVLTVVGARLESALFTDGISWQPSPGGIELPPGQTKSLPAQLPAPVCEAAGRGAAAPTVAVRIAPASSPASSPDSAAPESSVKASDPYGVLARNNTEMCLSQAAYAVARFRLDPGLEVAPDGRTAVVRLLITPRESGTGSDAGSLTVVRIDGTTLLAEDAADPWPHDVPVRAGGESREFRLGIRPARCDPHAVAEDKVGTLLPLRVTVAGRDGVLKVDAGPVLRGRIYDFVTAACTHQ
ncbi:hypothetical protein QFZ65_002154 [Arthrobacter sp. B3I9]|uniref:hypothetical protein n=1 Tax=Arthrobacter sp. B3I9 TaxID=3042270 RepID=UPI0027906D13|nr:hypothetical protein [Arthrobacter sp. B3I9]MDQ0850216.1 hypothetical protein [Arthrobacter sp. B3I9]